MGGYDPTDLQIGTELKKQYRIEKILGQRGIKKEYVAHDSFVPSIKWILQEFYPMNAFFRTPGENKVTIVTQGQKKDWIEHSMNEFLKEGLFLEELKEIKGIQACVNVFEENGTVYRVLEYPGEVYHLKDWLRKQKSFGVEKALDICLQVTHVYKELHQRGYYGYAFSPQEILMGLDGKITINYQALLYQHLGRDVILYPGYAPLEAYFQCTVQKDALADVYCAGAIMYRMLTGVEPQEATNRHSNGTSDDTLVAPAKICPEISKRVSDAVMKAMALNREKRFRSIEAFEKALKKAK